MALKKKEEACPQACRIPVRGWVDRCGPHLATHSLAFPSAMMTVRLVLGERHRMRELRPITAPGGWIWIMGYPVLIFGRTGSEWVILAIGYEERIDPDIWDLAERRAFAADFLEEAGECLALNLQQAAYAFRSIHDHMWRIHNLCGGEDQQAKLRDAGVRMEIARVIRECRKLDTEAADVIAEALHSDDNRGGVDADETF